MPSTEQKLTKKQKKALAFRTRSKKLIQDHGDAYEHETEGASGAALENEGYDSDQDPTPEVGRGQAKNVNMESRVKGEARVDSTVAPGIRRTPHSLKRKRESDIDQVEEKQKKVKLEREKDKTDGKGKERLILFVGNLKYATTVDAIKEHFSSCDPLPAVRLLTPKPPEGGKQTTKSKGCAFLEFANGKSLQQGLKLHHSKLDNRVINVELTVGGGGKGEARLKKLRERNEYLYSQREKKGGKMAAGDLKSVAPDQSQRYSATSGVGHAPKQKRTWTIGDVADEKKSKKQQRQVKKAKNQATGVNAIPVG